MKIILLTISALAVCLACIWALGVALQGQVFDHEEIRRKADEWEEME